MVHNERYTACFFSYQREYFWHYRWDRSYLGSFISSRPHDIDFCVLWKPATSLMTLQPDTRYEIRDTNIAPPRQKGNTRGNYQHRYKSSTNTEGTRFRRVLEAVWRFWFGGWDIGIAADELTAIGSAEAVETASKPTVSKTLHRRGRKQARAGNKMRPNWSIHEHNGYPGWNHRFRRFRLNII